MRQQGEGIQLKFDKPYHNGSHEGMDDEMIFANRERLTSESSISKQMRSHRKANSDPFDAAGMEGMGNEPVDDRGLEHEKRFALPTLHRFPFAEANDRNCWSEPPANIFEVRGADYLTDKKKITAKRYLLRAIGSDLFLADKPGKCDMGR